MTYNCDANSFSSHSRRGAFLGAAFLSGLIQSITRHAAERRAARTLLRMDDHLLRDIGISREEVQELVHTGRVDRERFDAPFDKPRAADRAS